jgi:hypothetical protein
LPAEAKRSHRNVVPRATQKQIGNPDRELRIQEPEFRRRRAPRAIPDSDFGILDSQKFTVG